jgi:hypothetical protein
MLTQARRKHKAHAPARFPSLPPTIFPFTLSFAYLPSRSQLFSYLVRCGKGELAQGQPAQPFASRGMVGAARAIERAIQLDQRPFFGHCCGRGGGTVGSCGGWCVWGPLVRAAGRRGEANGNEHFKMAAAC